MRESEITDLAKTINATYANAKPITPAALPVWFEDLADLEADDVRTAFTMHRRSGKEFPPNCAELRRLVLELHAPTDRFEAVWGAISHTVMDIGNHSPDRAETALAGVPLAWELVLAMGGWMDICLGGPNEFKATDPGVWRSQAEHAFRALIEQRRADMAIADIPSALPRIEQARERLNRQAQPMMPLARPVEALPEPIQQMRPPLAPPAMEVARPATDALRPEYRAEIETLIREGQEDLVPARWQRHIDGIRAAMEAGE